METFNNDFENNKHEDLKTILNAAKVIGIRSVDLILWIAQKAGQATEFVSKPVLKAGINKVNNSQKAPDFVKNTANKLPNLYKKIKENTRRKILGIVVIGGITYANYIDLGDKTVDKIEDGIEWIDNTSSEIKESIIHLFNSSSDSFEKGEKIEKGTIEYGMNGLTNRKLGGLYAKYLGTKAGDTVRTKMTINFPKNLNKLWQEKLNRKHGVTNVAKQTFNDLIINGYNMERDTKMSLDDYLEAVDKSINNINDNIDWKKVAKIKNLDDDKLKLLKKLANTIDGKDLISYAMTETMPSSDGNLNKNFIDFLLKNAGREYVELIPALYDKYTSFGLYQFTSYALYGIEGKERGASIINKALPKPEQIPGSVIKLKGNDHHKAAYLFAINNIADLIKQLNKKQLSTLSKNKDDNQIVHFIATAHHAPALARSSAKRWLDNDTKLPYKISCKGRIINYANKSEKNLKALQSY